MFERIVVGTDGSEGAQEALDVAGELAAGLGIPEVHVVTASHPLSSVELQQVRSQLPDEFKLLVDSHVPASGRLEDADAVLAHHGVGMIRHDIGDSPASAILDVAEDVDADLIIVGARGLGAVGRFLRGSVSDKVAHHSPCSVLVVEHRT